MSAAVSGNLPQDEAGRSHGVHPAYRGSIHLEDGAIVAQETWPGDQFVLRVNAPRFMFFFNGSNSHVGMRPQSRDASRPRSQEAKTLFD